MRKILFFLGVLSFVLCSHAQLTSISATITDSDNQTWNNCTWKLQWVSNGQQTNPNIYNINGVSITSSTYSSYLNQTGSCNGSGALSLTALDNTQVSPSGSQYVFTIQSNTSAPATQYLPLTISGSSMNLSTYLSVNSIAPRIKIGNLAGIYAYADIEITNETVGNIYWNVVASQSRQWNGSSWNTLVTSTWNGGTVVNPVVSPGFSCTGSPSTCFTGNISGNLSGNVSNAQIINNIYHVENFIGSTADVKFNSCISTVYALGGGICDATGFGATNQTIAATVSTAATPGVFLKLDEATIYQPSTSTVDMFSIGYNSGIDGLTVNALAVSNYNGNAVKFVTDCQGASTCYLSHFKLINGTNSTNPLTGNGILVQASISGNLTVVNVHDGTIIGFLNGIYLTASGTSPSQYANGNSFSNIWIDNAKNCINLYSQAGDIYGNKFINVDCEAGGGNISGAVGEWIHGTSVGSNVKSNLFENGSLWDYGTGSNSQSAYIFDNTTTTNLLSANMPFGGNVTNTDSGTNNQVWNFSFALAMTKLGIGQLTLTPSPGNTLYYLGTNGVGNQACLSYGPSFGSNYAWCADSSGNLNSYGNLNVGTSGTANYLYLNPSTIGGTKFYLSNNGSINTLQISNGNSPGTNPINFYSSGGLDISNGIGGLTLKDEGSCTMSAGACPSQTLGHSYTVGPYCIGNWTGSGTFTGVLKFPTTASTVTPTSTINTDTAVISWVCFGK